MKKFPPFSPVGELEVAELALEVELDLLPGQVDAVVLHVPR